MRGTEIVTSKDPVIVQALQRVKVASEAEAKQRDRELRDLKFDAGEQWPEEIKEQRAGRTGPVPVPSRPCLTINKLDAPVLQVLNQQRNAKLAIQVKPRGGGASKDVAQVYQGLIRHIEVESRAQVARSWAFERAAKVGRGFYRILKTYSNDGDFDQDIVVSRILNQHSVLLDPFALEPDWSDGEWAFIFEDIEESRYKREYPDSKLAHYDESELNALGAEAPKWVNAEKESRVYRIAEYFWVEKKKRLLIVVDPMPLLPEGYTGFEDELPEGLDVKLLAIVQKRTAEERIVHWMKINAVEVLEETIWDGRYIPIVPVVGREYNVNGERSFKGIVHNAIDAHRSYNYMRSAQVEAIGLAPRAPFIMAEGQDEGYEDMWANANTVNYPALKYRPITLLGMPVPPPQRNVTEPAIQAITMAAQAADEDIKATTGVGDPSLGLMTPSDRSARAIKALQQQSEAGNSNYMDNLANISMTLEGKILVNLIPKVYDRPGRILRILGEDDVDQSVMLGAQGQQPGQPPAPPPQAEVQLAPSLATSPMPVGDLALGEYSVVVTVGKSYATRREEQNDMIGQLITAAPQMAPVISDLWVGSMDFPASRAIAARLHKMLPPQLQEGNGTGQPPVPPQVQQQMQQAQATIQQLQAQMQEMTMKMQTKQQELEAKAQVEQMKIEAKAQSEALDRASKERIEEFKAHAQMASASAQAAASQHKAELNAIMSQTQFLSKQRHDAASQLSAQRHESVMEGARQGHEVALASADASATREREREARLFTPSTTGD